MIKKQTYGCRQMAESNTALLSNLGLDRPDGIYYRQGKSWSRYQVCRDDTFALVAVERYCATDDETISYTKQEDYIKINFWLNGKHTTVLDGFGQHDHDRPEVFITAGPLDLVKIDVLSPESHVASVSLSVKREFFPVHMGLVAEELPEPLRALVSAEDRPFAFHRFTLSPDLVAATRSILAASFAVRSEAIYRRAKATELMCLLISMMNSETRKVSTNAHGRRESRLYEARELLTRRYSEAITLEQLSREVGLNRMALTSGFRELFGMSVYDCLQKERMERAYELLQDETYSITRIAEAVGYSHSCNFSTAFHGYFGCTPQKVRSGR